MTACTQRECEEWRSRLSGFECADRCHYAGAPFSALTLNIKSLGAVFGKPGMGTQEPAAINCPRNLGLSASPGTIARRISIHRATTVGPKPQLCQVVLKNTTMVKDSSTSTLSSSSINRSQSLLTTNRLPILAPSRAERARLEALLADVWSREILPFPSMTAKARGEHHSVRASATQMIRKLSVAATITSSFTRRSTSLTSMSKGGQTVDVDDCRSTPSRDSRGGGSSSDSPSAQRRSRGMTFRSFSTPHLDRPSGEMLAMTPSVAGGELPPRGRTVTPGSMREKDGTDSGAYLAKPVEAEMNVRTAVGMAALRTSSANSLPLSRRSSPMSRKSPCSTEKENLRRPPVVVPVKARGWGRVGAIRQGQMAQGFRNIFR